MALTISGATFGVDANELRTALNNINVQVIEAAKSEMRKGLSDLQTAVDTVWVGQSAETFKTNMVHDQNTIASKLDATYKSLVSEFARITKEMFEKESTLVTRRGE